MISLDYVAALLNRYFINPISCPRTATRPEDVDNFLECRILNEASNKDKARPWMWRDRKETRWPPPAGGN